MHLKFNFLFKLYCRGHLRFKIYTHKNYNFEINKRINEKKLKHNKLNLNNRVSISYIFINSIIFTFKTLFYIGLHILFESRVE